MTPHPRPATPPDNPPGESAFPGTTPTAPNAVQQYGTELVCTGDEGDHDGPARTIVFVDVDGAEADRSGPHCHRHAVERAASWSALPNPHGWTALVVEDGPATREGDHMTTWDCEAYGPAGKTIDARCFFTDPGARSCSTQAECRDRMAGERTRIYERIQNLAAAGDPIWQYLAEEITDPQQILSGAPPADDDLPPRAEA